MVELCKKYQNNSVVAIDLAGDEMLKASSDHKKAYEVCGISFFKTTIRKHPQGYSWLRDMQHFIQTTNNWESLKINCSC